MTTPLTDSEKLDLLLETIHTIVHNTNRGRADKREQKLIERLAEALLGRSLSAHEREQLTD